MIDAAGEQPVGWWLWLWGVVAVGLLVSLIFVPFRWWAVAALAGFGTMESVGLFSSHHASGYYPPLTDVIHEYVRYWATFPAIWAIWGWAFYYWQVWRHPILVGVMVGLLGWLNAHFDETYD